MRCSRPSKRIRLGNAEASMLTCESKSALRINDVPHSIAREMHLCGLDPKLCERESMPIMLRRSLESTNSFVDETITDLSDLIYPGEFLKFRGQTIGSKNLEHVVRVFAIHKPRNTVTDMNHPYFSRIKMQLLELLQCENQRTKVHPVGQLDKNTTGLLLFCTNGDAANYLNLPGTTRKTYVATYYAPSNRAPTANQISRLCNGVDITRGNSLDRKNRVVVKAEEFRLLSTERVPSSPANHPKYSYKVQLTINSGANHVVKRLLSAVGLPPIRQLCRTAYGDLKFDHFGEDLARPSSRVVELDEKQIALAGLPSEDDIVALKLCQLLCRYRQGGCSDERLKEFLLCNHTLKGKCFDGFPQLKCRGKADHSKFFN